jgi:hypothetical protein
VPLTFANTVTPEQVRWLWPGYIPFGKVTVLDGDPGLGKSTIAIDLAARLSTGGELPNGKRHKPMGTILMMGEDGAGDTIVPRLINAGADLARVGIQDGYINDKGNIIPPSFPSDIPKLKEDILAANAGMVVIDPIMSYLDPDINSNNDQQIRRALMPLAALAEETGVAIVMLRHLNKSSSSSALYRGGGSIGFVGVARSGLIVARDPDAPERVVLASTKSNLGPPPPALNYRLVGCENGAARVEWEGHSTHTAETLVQNQVSSEDRSAMDEAIAFLRESLSIGIRLAKEVQKEARDAGISERTLRRAREMLGITMDSPWMQKAKTQDGQFTWELPRRDVDQATGKKRTNGEEAHTQEAQNDVGQRLATTPSLANMDNLANFTTYIEDDQDGHLVHTNGVATLDSSKLPKASSSGPGYDCAVCGQPIRYAMKGLPLLCPKHRDTVRKHELAAD